MREITDHIVEGDLPQNQLTIEVTDEPGAGGANHNYVIHGFRSRVYYEMATAIFGPLKSDKYEIQAQVFIPFQNGPIKEAGVNGVTQEALLAIVIDRLRSFQAGPFPSSFNARALLHCEAALSLLQERTRERLSRGVEGETKA